MSSNRTPAVQSVRRWLIAASIALSIDPAAGAWGGDPCAPEWSGQFTDGGVLLGTTRAAMPWDPDGAGPQPVQLLAAGSQVGLWDGDRWTLMGSLGGVNCFAMFDDDGPGPNAAALFAGGNFLMANGAPSDYIAKWNGSTWVGVTSGLNNQIEDMIVWDEDGPGPGAAALYVAGWFSSVDGQPTTSAVKWDGNTWFPMGTDELSFFTAALAVFDEDHGGPMLPSLFAGGAYLKRWNGSGWEDVGGGTSGGVFDMLVTDLDGPGPQPESLYVGGEFMSVAGSVPAEGVACWNGSAWSPLGLGLGGLLYGPVYALEMFDADGPGGALPVLHAGGSFTHSGTNPVSGAARWNGVAWSPLQSGTTVTTAAGVYAMAAVQFSAAGAPARALIVGGDFQTVGAATYSDLALWDGTQWLASGDGVGAVSQPGPTANQVRAMVIFDDDGPAGPHPPMLHIAGRFATAGSTVCNNVARWNGQSWEALGLGTNGIVNALEVFDEDGAGPGLPALFAAGNFTGAGGGTCNRIARWNGVAWSALGLGIANNEALCMTVFDNDGGGPNPPALYIGGSFTTAGGASVGRVARWSNGSWSAVGNGVGISPPFPLQPEVFAIAGYDADGPGPALAALYIGGTFNTGPNYIARLDGSTWASVGGGLSSTVRAMLVFDFDGPGPILPVLVAGGTFNQAAGVIVRNIAQWNGTSWSGVGWGFSSSATNVFVYALGVLDDDGVGPNAPSLYAAGDFEYSIKPVLNNIARWTGTTWTWLEDGISAGASDDLVYSLCSFDGDPAGPSLYAGGRFFAASNEVSLNIARWGCPIPIVDPCPADIAPTPNGDGSVNVSDLLAVINGWGACAAPCPPHCAADVDDNCQVNVTDLLAVINAWGSCP